MTDFTELVKLLTAMVSLLTALVVLSKALKQGSKPKKRLIGQNVCPDRTSVSIH